MDRNFPDERSILFGPNQGLVGTLCLPAAGATPGSVGVILFNAGVVHRVGPHRINVRLARKLAAAGIASLRFDLAGQGDSARPKGDQALGYDEQAIADLRAAMDYFSGATGIAQFAFFGFCSGGYHGYPTSLVDKRVAGLLIYDAFVYPTNRSRLNRYMMRIRHRGLITAFAGGAMRAVARIGSRIREALQDSNASYKAATTRESLPSPADLASGIRELLSRQVRVGFMYAGGSLDHYNYQDQFAETFGKFGIVDQVQVQYFQQLDHAGSILSQQAILIDRIVAWMKQVGKPNEIAA